MLKIARKDNQIFHIFSIKREGRFLSWEGEGEGAQHTGLIRCMAWNRDGTMLATAGDDKVVKLWQRTEGLACRSLGQTPCGLLLGFFASSKRRPPTEISRMSRMRRKNSKKLTSVVFGSGPDGDTLIYADKVSSPRVCECCGCTLT